jgi:hypothetical protein
VKISVVPVERDRVVDMSDPARPLFGVVIYTPLMLSGDPGFGTDRFGVLLDERPDEVVWVMRRDLRYCPTVVEEIALLGGL